MPLQAGVIVACQGQLLSSGHQAAPSGEEGHLLRDRGARSADHAKLSARFLFLRQAEAFEKADCQERCKDFAAC